MPLLLHLKTRDINGTPLHALWPVSNEKMNSEFLANTRHVVGFQSVQTAFWNMPWWKSKMHPKKNATEGLHWSWLLSKEFFLLIITVVIDSLRVLRISLQATWWRDSALSAFFQPQAQHWPLQVTTWESWGHHRYYRRSLFPVAQGSKVIMEGDERTPKLIFLCFLSRVFHIFWSNFWESIFSPDWRLDPQGAHLVSF